MYDFLMPDFKHKDALMMVRLFIDKWERIPDECDLAVFSSARLITDQVVAPKSVRAFDADGDGDLDLVSASSGDNRVAWYENLGGGTFGLPTVLSTSSSSAVSVDAGDLDQDGSFDAGETWLYTSEGVRPYQATLGQYVNVVSVEADEPVTQEQVSDNDVNYHFGSDTAEGLTPGFWK